MQPTKSFVVLSLALAASACTPPGVPLSDYCAIASEITIRDLAEPGSTVTVGPDGWGDKSTLTRRDAETIGSEAGKYQQRCKKDQR